MLALVKILFERHDFFFTTVVDKPVQNLALRSLLEWIGAQQIGFIHEEYPQVGQITSAMYCIDQASYRYCIEDQHQHLPLVARVLRTMNKLTQNLEKDTFLA